jgi:predicted flap endonuclease-1-like 5' DNA nuclease
LRRRILRLEQGFPQNWIYIERKVKHPLTSEEPEGVKASTNFIGKQVTEIFRQDLLNVQNLKITTIRPVIGPNGAGKTTLLKFKVRERLNQISPNRNLYLFFDFKEITEDKDQFWDIFVQELISQLIDEENNILTELIENISSHRRRLELNQKFRNKQLIDHLLKLIIKDPGEREIGLNYFYGGILNSKTIRDLFFGFIELALDQNYLVIIGFDELQFLNEIDKSNVLIKLFLESFIRHLMEKFSNERLYLVLSCLQNPKKEEWTNLKEQSKNFKSIIENKEIVLGNLTSKEKEAIITQVAEKIRFKRKERKLFFKKVKESLYYYLPRELLKCIANVIDSMDYTYHTEYEIRKIYESDTREFMEDKLKSKGFIHLEPDVKKIGGYNLDIYATAPTHRSNYVKKAFGEASMIQRSSIKRKVEKFADWLLRMRGREFNPNKGDYAFFITPPNNITEEARKVLDDNNIEFIAFKSSNLEQIIEHERAETEEAVVEPTEIEIEPEPSIETEKPKRKKEKEGKLFLVKEDKYSLEDVPGIGPKNKEKLNEAGIHTIKDLLNCNAKLKAKEIYRVGVASINKWKKNARQIIKD